MIECTLNGVSILYHSRGRVGMFCGYIALNILNQFDHHYVSMLCLRANIFSCGGSEDVKMPSIYIHPNSDDEGAAWEGFLIVWSTNLDWNNYISPGPYLMRNKTYDVVLDVTQKRLKLTIDGDVVYNQGKDSHENLLTVPCFASAPFEDSADVEISNILIAPGLYIHLCLS